MKDALEHFVETELPELLAKARAAERERIAKLIDERAAGYMKSIEKFWGNSDNGRHIEMLERYKDEAEQCARVIRAMGDEKP